MLSSPHHATGASGRRPGDTPLASDAVGLIKTLVKLAVLVTVAAAIAGVVMLVRRSPDSAPVSFDEWPEVPRNPDA